MSLYMTIGWHIGQRNKLEVGCLLAFRHYCESVSLGIFTQILTEFVSNLLHRSVEFSIVQQRSSDRYVCITLLA